MPIDPDLSRFPNPPLATALPIKPMGVNGYAMFSEASRTCTRSPSQQSLTVVSRFTHSCGFNGAALSWTQQSRIPCPPTVAWFYPSRILSLGSKGGDHSQVAGLEDLVVPMGYMMHTTRILHCLPSLSRCRRHRPLPLLKS